MNEIHNTSTAETADTGMALERLFEVGVLLTQALETGLADQGLTQARAEVLWRLHHGGPMTQRVLAEALQCTPRNVTSLVDGLEAGGLVVRNPHPTDRRATLVALSETGTATVADWQDGYHDLAAMLFTDLSATELRRLGKALDKVVARLRERADTPSPRRLARRPAGSQRGMT